MLTQDRKGDMRHSQKVASVSYGERPRRWEAGGEPNLPAPWSWTSSIQSSEKVCAVVQAPPPPVCGPTALAAK